MQDSMGMREGVSVGMILNKLPVLFFFFCWGGVMGFKGCNPINFLRTCINVPISFCNELLYYPRDLAYFFLLLNLISQVLFIKKILVKSTKLNTGIK